VFPAFWLARSPGGFPVHASCRSSLVRCGLALLCLVVVWRPARRISVTVMKAARFRWLCHPSLFGFAVSLFSPGTASWTFCLFFLHHWLLGCFAPGYILGRFSPRRGAVDGGFSFISQGSYFGLASALVVRFFLLISFPSFSHHRASVLSLAAALRVVGFSGTFAPGQGQLALS